MLKSLTGRVFQRDQSSFLAGAALAQLLPFLAAPLLVRLYSPEAFGNYAVFAAFVAITSTASAFAVHNAILIERENASAMQVAAFALVISAASGLALLALVYALPTAWLIWALGDKVLRYLPYAALTVTFSGTLLTIYTWQVRRAFYPLLARSKIAQGITMVTVQIVCGFAGMGTAGMVVASILGFAAGLLTLLPTFVRDYRQFDVRISRAAGASLLRRHHRLPLFTVPAQLVNAVGSQLPELLINKLFGPSVLGQYSLANRVINQPLSFISTAVQDIFRQKASQELRDHGTCSRTFIAFLGFMTLAAAGIIGPLTLLAPRVFAFLFGEQWLQAAHMAQALAFLLAVRFVSSPLSYVWIMRNKQSQDLLWQLGLMAIAAGSFVGAYLALPNASPTTIIFVYSGLTGLWYVLCLAFSYRYAR